MLAAPLAAWRGQWNAAVALWGVALVLRVVGLARPQALRPVFLALTLVTFPIGWVVSHLTLAMIFYGSSRRSACSSDSSAATR